MDMDMILERLLDGQTLFFLGIFFTVVFVTLLRTIASILRTSQQERTKREIAAYIAEGSMTPEQGERLLKAGGRDRAC